MSEEPDLGCSLLPDTVLLGAAPDVPVEEAVWGGLAMLALYALVLSI